MLYFVIAVLVLVVIIFGMSSTSQSYATAQQAKAQIETAQLGQINAWGNLITILTMALIILVVLAILVFALYWFFVRPRTRTQARAATPRGLHNPNSAPALDAGIAISQLVQLETLRLLSSMNTKSSEPRALLDVSPEEDEISWLLK